MAFTGEREFIQNHLDYLWSEMQSLLKENTTDATRQQEIDNEYAALERQYVDYYERLGQLWPRETG